MRKLLLSTNSTGKVREFGQILAGLPLEIVTPRALGLDLRVEETGATFAENAEIKARAYHEATGLLALSDDSGIEVEALGGAPGVYSARYAGLPDGDEKNRYLLRQLEGIPWEGRGCRYVCEIAIVDESERVHRSRGVLSGKVAQEPRGDGGFGYDPIFFVPDEGKTVAEMPAEDKHRISHRGIAGRRAREILAKILADASA